MGYKPDMNARALATRKSYLIAILCRETYRQSALDVIQGIQATLLPSDYSLLVYARGDKASDEATHLQSALDRGAEGLIVYPALDLDGLSNADRFKSLQGRVPVVQMLPTLPGLPAIRRNDERAARLVTRHMIELGHRRIVHLTHAYYRDPDHRRFYYDAYARGRGYEQEMLEAVRFATRR
jgi:LacI family transcriptional regulator